MWHLFKSHKDVDPGELTDLRSASVNNENFAQVAVKHKLQHHLQHGLGLLLEQITEYVKGLEDSNEENYSLILKGLSKGPKVQGQLSLLSGGILTFGLSHYPYSEFKLMDEELLMSDSIIKVYGALRMSVKMFLTWNSKIYNNRGGDTIVATSILEASNLVVLKKSSVIHSNANLGVHGQGLLNLSGPGDMIEAQRLILSLFYSINVGPGSVLRGPLINATSDEMAPKLNCEEEEEDCLVELIHPPEDCNVNSSLSFTLQICRVEDIDVAVSLLAFC